MQRLASLITSLNKRGAEHSSWLQFAEEASQLFNADGCMFCFADMESPEMPIFKSVGQLSQESFNVAMSQDEKHPLYQLLRDTPVGQVISNGNISLTDFDDNFLQSQVMAATVYRDDKYQAFLSIVRHGERADFGEGERQLLNALLPHMNSVVKAYFHSYVMQKNADIQLFIQQFSDYVAVIDQQGAVLAANDAFEQLKHSKQLLYVYGGKVKFYQKPLQYWLNEFLLDENRSSCRTFFKVIEQQQTVVVKLSTFEQKPYFLNGQAQQQCLLYIENFDVNLRFEQYKLLFKLTKAEAQLAANLSMGKTINQLANEKLLSKHTLRTQLKSVFMKTDTHSQNELIVLLKNVV